MYCIINSKASYSINNGKIIIWKKLYYEFYRNFSDIKKNPLSLSHTHKDMCMCTCARFSWLPSPFLKLIWKGIYETTKSLPTYHCQMHRSPAFIIRFLPLFLLLTRFHRFSFILDPQGKRNIVIYCNKEKRNLRKTVESKIAFFFSFFSSHH